MNATPTTANWPNDSDAELDAFVHDDQPPSPKRERAFALYCQGLRSPAIAHTLDISERTIRHWLRTDLRALADERNAATRREQLTLALAQQQALYAAAWAGYERAAAHEAATLARAQAQHTLATRYAADPKSNTAAAALSVPAPRLSGAGARYLALALAAQRELRELQQLYDSTTARQSMDLDQPTSPPAAAVAAQWAARERSVADFMAEEEALSRREEATAARRGQPMPWAKRSVAAGSGSTHPAATSTTTAGASPARAARLRTTSAKSQSAQTDPAARAQHKSFPAAAPGHPQDDTVTDDDDSNEDKDDLNDADEEEVAPATHHRHAIQPQKTHSRQKRQPLELDLDLPEPGTAAARALGG